MSQYLKLMKNKNFSLLWFSSLISQLGDSINYIAVVGLAYKITKSGISIATVTIFEIMPMILIGLIAGALVDRFKVKHILVYSDIIRGIIVLPLMFISNIWAIYIITGFLSFVTCFAEPGKRSILPRILSKDDLVIGNSITSTTFNFTIIIGPALGGILIAYLNFKVAFFINALSFFISGLIIAFISLKENKQKKIKNNESVKNQVIEGIKLIYDNKIVFKIILIIGLVMLGRGGINSLIIVFIKETLNMGTTEYGYFNSITGFGLVIGSLLAGYLGTKINELNLLKISILIAGITYLIYSNINNFYFILVFVIFNSISNTIYGVAGTTLLQKLVPDEYLGRVFSVSHLITNVSFVISTAIFGGLTKAIGIR